MYHPDQLTSREAIATLAPVSISACLVPGCPCKDARIVSHRRAAFFSAMARRNGETADRSIAPEAGWRLPSPRADVIRAT